jgi:trimeric autotransporter adhesin
MKKLYGFPALVSPRVLLGAGLVLATSLFGGTGCGLSYSLTGIYLEPTSGSTCIPQGGTAKFTAYGTYTEGNHSMRIEDISDQVQWSVPLPELASVNASGLATASDNFIGTTPVVATTRGEFGVLTSSSSLQVSNSCVSTAIAKHFSLHIVPENQSLNVGQTLQPLAVGTYGLNGATTNLSRQVAWQSSDTKVATVDSKGLITAVGPGDATITAQTRGADGELATATETVHFYAIGQDK